MKLTNIYSRIAWGMDEYKATNKENAAFNDLVNKTLIQGNSAQNQQIGKDIIDYNQKRQTLNNAYNSLTQPNVEQYANTPNNSVIQNFIPFIMRGAHYLQEFVKVPLDEQRAADVAKRFTNISLELDQALKALSAVPRQQNPQNRTSNKKRLKRR